MANRFDVLSPRPKKGGGTFWHRVGTAWQGDKGINVVFDSIPLPDAEGRVSVSLFEPRDNNGGSARGNGGGQSYVGVDDGDAPF
jgi:hypothetical protein